MKPIATASTTATVSRATPRAPQRKSSFGIMIRRRVEPEDELPTVRFQRADISRKFTKLPRHSAEVDYFSFEYGTPMAAGAVALPTKPASRSTVST